MVLTPDVVHTMDVDGGDDTWRRGQLIAEGARYVGGESIIEVQLSWTTVKLRKRQWRAAHVL
jgi:hypothetical protein